MIELQIDDVELKLLILSLKVMLNTAFVPSFPYDVAMRGVITQQDQLTAIKLRSKLKKLVSNKEGTPLKEQS